MKTISIILLILLLPLSYSSAQQTGEQLYNPNADAKAELKIAIATAAKEGKHVIIQVGGNWCPWCIRLHKFYHENASIDSILNASYVFAKVNYSKENKNSDVLKDLGFPQRFGFPVLVILDANGQRLHTQNSAYLEEGKGYDAKKVLEFLKQWSPEALKPDNYPAN